MKCIEHFESGFLRRCWSVRLGKRVAEGVDAGGLVECC